MNGKNSQIKATVILLTGVALFILFNGFVITELSEGWQQAWAGLLILALGVAFLVMLGRDGTLHCDRAQNICTLTRYLSLTGRGSVTTFRLETLRVARVYEHSGDGLSYDVMLETADGPAGFTSVPSKARANAFAKRINRFVHSRAGDSLILRSYSRTTMLAGGTCIIFGAYLMLRAALG
ncbi:MAG TPA: hypothetical protein VNA17_11265 [Pyrinomonadaceae bacterium]|nr:hypothetical protein [Pyrinomonadaceae bacterium]